MGGKSYFCDYCECFMKNDINVRKNHNIGMLHNIAKANYLQKYKDPQEIITDETKKIPCKRFLNNKECQFGFFCRYSHYFPEDLAHLKTIVDTKQDTKDKEHTGAGDNLPWKYRSAKRNLHHLPPSLLPIDFNKVTESCFQSQWG